MPAAKCTDIFFSIFKPHGLGFRVAKFRYPKTLLAQAVAVFGAAGSPE